MAHALQVCMAKQTKAPKKRTATKRVRKTGNQSRRATAAAPPQRSKQKRRSRGAGDTARKTAEKQTAPRQSTADSQNPKRTYTAALKLVRANPLALRREGSAAVRLYTQRARAAISAAWDGVAANIIARGRRLFGQIQNVSQHMTQSSAQKKRLA
jgi:hypothetical protein